MEPSEQQLKIIEANRQAAKTRLLERVGQNDRVQYAEIPGENGKRAAMPSFRKQAEASTSRNASNAAPAAKSGDPNAGQRPLTKDPRLGTYFEFDLSKMKNSRGGFLVDEDNGLNGKTLQQVQREKQREMERLKASRKMEPSLHYGQGGQPECQFCRSIELDQELQQNFKVLICAPCRKIHKERFSLLTKSEVKEDYMLTDPELKDEEILPHILRANPLNPTWNNMMLYLREHAEAFAIKKWGGLEALDEEWERRQAEKTKKRGKKFEDKLRGLRSRTKNSVWQQRQDSQHSHEFEQIRTAANTQIERCTTCGFEMESEVF